MVTSVCLGINAINGSAYLGIAGSVGKLYSATLFHHKLFQESCLCFLLHHVFPFYVITQWGSARLRHYLLRQCFISCFFYYLVAWVLPPDLVMSLLWVSIKDLAFSLSFVSFSWVRTRTIIIIITFYLLPLSLPYILPILNLVTNL